MQSTAHDFCSPSRTHTGAHCAGWRPSGRPRRNPGRFSGGFPWRTCSLQRIWVVLLCICCNGCGVQTNEGGVHDPHLIELLHLCRHDFFQRTVVQLPQEAVICPVGRQRFHNVKPAVMGDDAIVVQIIRQICDL